MVHPHILPPSLVDGASEPPPAPRPPRVEYLATLARHSAAVNVVRFSPNGEYTPSCHRNPDLWNAPPQLDMMVE